MTPRTHFILESTLETMRKRKQKAFAICELPIPKPTAQAILKRYGVSPAAVIDSRESGKFTGPRYYLYEVSKTLAAIEKTYGKNQR